MKRIFVLTVAMLVMGCGVKKPIEGRLDPHVPAQIHFTDRILSDNTAVGVPLVTRDESGSILHVQVPIRSTVNEQLFIDYRATFMDRNGQTLSQSGWMTKVLDPNVPDQIAVNSMSPRAADFQVDFRYAK